MATTPKPPGDESEQAAPEPNKRSPGAKPAAARARSKTAKGRAKPGTAKKRAGAKKRTPAKARNAGSVDTVMSVEAGAEEAAKIALNAPKAIELEALLSGPAMVKIDSLRAGYGPMEVLHGFSLCVSAGQSLCLIGPNGAGKSTVLHSIFGFADIMSGSIWVNERNTTNLSPSEKLRSAGIAYVLQDNSVFPDMTVEENLWMGGFLKPTPHEARLAADRVFSKYERLAERRHQPARVLSGGERRLLEISRALVMDPKVLLVDEPSIGLEPRFIDMVFEILSDLKQSEGKTIIMVEQNAKKGLEFADIGYVLAAGELAKAGTGDALLADPEVGRLFLGG